jgi:hypothetical protein
MSFQIVNGFTNEDGVWLKAPGNSQLDSRIQEYATTYNENIDSDDIDKLRERSSDY